MIYFLYKSRIIIRRYHYFIFYTIMQNVVHLIFKNEFFIIHSFFLNSDIMIKKMK